MKTNSPTAKVSQDCPFCISGLFSQAVASKGSVFAIRDKHPVTAGHLLIIPRRHSEDFFAMTEQERREAEELMFILRDKILASDPSVLGFNIGVNCGNVAGQTIMHAHIHLIPRRMGDTPRPAGGVRGVIPGKRAYQLTAESVQH